MEHYRVVLSLSCCEGCNKRARNFTHVPMDSGITSNNDKIGATVQLMPPFTMTLSALVSVLMHDATFLSLFRLHSLSSVLHHCCEVVSGLDVRFGPKVGEIENN